MSSCSTRCISFTPSLHELLPCLRYCGDDDDLLNDDDDDMEDMAFDDKECDDCMSCVDDDCCDEVSCDGSSVHDKVGVGDDGNDIDNDDVGDDKFVTLATTLLRRR